MLTTKYATLLLGSSGSGEGNEFFFLGASLLVRVGDVYKHQVGIHWSPWTPAIATYLREDKSKVSIAHFLLLYIRTTYASIQVFVFFFLAIKTA